MFTLTNDLNGIIEALGKEDHLIVPELSRLGRSMLEIIEILSIAMQKEINVYIVKGNRRLDDSIESKVLAMAFSLAAEIERDFIFARTREALKARQAKGIKLGRLRGAGKSKLDPHKEKIIALLQVKAERKFIAEKFGVTTSTLHNWIGKNGVEVGLLSSLFFFHLLSHDPLCYHYPTVLVHTNLLITLVRSFHTSGEVSRTNMNDNQSL